MTYAEWMDDYFKNRPHERLGQAFVNDFIKNAWSELFYQTDTQEAIWMIWDWLNDHQYYPNMPEKIVRN